jgi:hypothetical protein
MLTICKHIPLKKKAKAILQNSMLTMQTHSFEEKAVTTL